VKINLGSGNQRLKGFYNIDQYPYPKVDKVYDLNKGIPLKDNSVDEIYTSYFLHYIKDLYFFIHEMYRVCKNGAKIIIIESHFTSPPSDIETNKWRYNAMNYFDYYNKDAKLVRKNFFIFKKRELIFGGVYKVFGFLKHFPNLYENSFLRSIIFCSSVKLELEVVKDEHTK